MGMDSTPLFQRTKRKLFVSYDHYRDSGSFESFQRLFSSLGEIVRDNSVARELDIGEPDAFVQNLRETNFENVLCMVLLCGARTHLDKFVDWEIKASLDHKIGLLGIILPDNPTDATGQPTLPERMQINFDSGYGIICRWEQLAEDKIDLSTRVVYAMERSSSLIKNDRPLRLQNG
jgi:hypothetical protein